MLPKPVIIFAVFAGSYTLLTMAAAIIFAGEGTDTKLLLSSICEAVALLGAASLYQVVLHPLMERRAIIRKLSRSVGYLIAVLFLMRV